MRKAIFVFRRLSETCRSIIYIINLILYTCFDVPEKVADNRIMYWTRGAARKRLHIIVRLIMMIMAPILAVVITVATYRVRVRLLRCAMQSLSYCARRFSCEFTDDLAPVSFRRRMMIGC